MVLFMGKRKRLRLSVILEIGQWVSAVIVVGGVVCEYLYKADLFLLVITTGVFSWAIVQKLKHPSRKRH